ncbi:MAG TPA: hypothetical protein VFW33_19675 [Gemmataceae bacterium]|nr:hypothetical protein [Gemmataceae bacterium]
MAIVAACSLALLSIILRVTEHAGFVAVLFTKLALLLFGFWRRTRVADAPAVLAADSRPPIVLLRAFSDDHLGFGQPLSWLGMGTLSVEKVLHDLFSRWGPMITIGRPGERLPPLGVARFTVRGDWQWVIDHLLLECRLVVMLMGDLGRHPGLTWEVQRVFRLRTLEKLVLILPPVTEPEAQRRWDDYSAWSGGRLPPYEGGEIAAIFLPDGSARVARVQENWLSSYSRGAGSYREVFRIEGETGEDVSHPSW